MEFMQISTFVLDLIIFILAIIQFVVWVREQSNRNK